MKKMLSMMAVVLMLIIMSFPAVAIDDKPVLAVSRMNSRNSSEFIEIYNYASQEVEISELTVRVFNSAGNQNFFKTFKNAILAPNGLIAIIQGGTSANSDESFSANSITPQGGKIEIWLNGQLVSDMCWGAINSCSDDITISDNEIFMSGRCQEDFICANETKRFGWLTAILSCEYNAAILTNDPLCVEPPEDPDDPPINPKIDKCIELMITEISANVDEGEKFIEISNPTDSAINLVGCQIVTYNESGNPPSGSKTFVFREGVLDTGQYLAIKIVDTTLKLNKTTGGTICILSIDGSIEEPCVTYSKLKANSSWALIGDEWQETFVLTPGAANPLPKPLNLCEGLRLNEIGANLDEQFIEILNSTNHDINITGCRLMTNRSTTKYYEFDEEILSSGALKVIKISDTNLTLTKTTAGTVYLLSSNGQTEIDTVAYANLKKDTSWALVDGEWVQTFNITMGRANIYQEFPDCQQGYFRNVETGRCNKIVESAVLAPCPAGQYRHPETNRCRKLETGSTLTPCQEGYERNPLTNRCRKIVEDTGPKPCADGYERNPETNRCRKITSSLPGQYAVRIDPPGANSLWKWASGGIVLATVAIVTLQYRMEIGQLFRKLLQKINRRDLAMEIK